MEQENTGNIGFIITCLSLFINLSDIDKLTSIAAGMVAIVAGVCTSIYYIKKTKELSHEKGNKRGPKNNN